MASKDELSFLKGKHQSLTNNVLHTDKKSQYSNLNLNRNQNSSFLIPVQYPSNPKYDKYCDSEVSDKREKSADLCSHTLTLNDKAEEGAKKDWKKNGLSYANSSTLSFHISAYENSKETAGLVTLDGENVELKNLDNQLFPRLMIQTPFEFPRQQEEDQVTEPEVAEFRASQRLLGSAQPTSSNTARIPPVKMSSKQKRAAAKKGGKKPTTSKIAETNGTTDIDNEIDAAAAILQKIELENAQARSVAAVLASQPKSRDLKVEQLTITFHGREIVTDTTLEINQGRRYGLIGLNGSGKSTLLQAIYNREMPVPEHFDMFLVSREMAASEMSALKAVYDVDKERKELEKQAEELASCEDDESQATLMDIYDRLDEMEADKAEVKAAALLYGLGFSRQMMLKKCKDFSGGWRMRIALARALYLKPTILLLDEPTNHLDLDACVWLETELAQYKRCLLIVSHSQDFMNNVCTNVIHLFQKKLFYYSGGYDTFIKTREELLENQAKRYKWEQDQLANMKDYIARFGHGSAKLARQAQSKEKTMAKMIAGGLTERVQTETVKQFYFFDAGDIPPPVIMIQHVFFKYSEDGPYIYKDLDFGIDLDTRVALVGPNGAGKSTLLKLLAGSCQPTEGMIRRHAHCKLGLYHQHLHEELPIELSALEYMMKSYPDVKEIEEMRKIIGRYGLTGREQVCPMKQLSDGQRCRVSFAWLAWQQPHLLLLDEPTNHLDMESIDALAEAINSFKGGLILVSHDFRLVQQVTEEIWICDEQKITKWQGDIFSYKEMLRVKIAKNIKQAIER